MKLIYINLYLLILTYYCSQTRIKKRKLLIFNNFLAVWTGINRTLTLHYQFTPKT